MTTVRTALSALLLCSLASCLLSCQRKPLTSFERQNREARRQNPAGLEFQLRTSDNRTTYHLFESIPLDLAFSSSAVATYSIELDDEMNNASLRDKLLTDPADSVSSVIPGWLGRGFICCGSDPQYLSSGPTVLQEDLTDIFRFEKPGRYEIYATTQRIFRGKDASMEENYGPSKFTVTSNILALTILPDDPQWDSQQLAAALRTLRDPRVQADYAKAWKTSAANSYVPEADDVSLHKAYQTKFAQARRALNAIDSPAAIQERVSLMNLVPAKNRQENEVLFQPLLQSSTRPDLIVSAMESRAADPNFGVDTAFSDSWAEYTIQRDHPDLFRLSSDEVEPGKKQQAFQLSWTASQKYEIQFLERALKSKKGEARSTTTSTIGHLKEEIAPAKRNNTKH